jgi:S1-C subfamily serine protease
MLAGMRKACVVVCAALAACASEPRPGPATPPAATASSLLPGGIGIFTKRALAGVVVAEVKEEGAAASAGVRVGDVLLRYNGSPVNSVRDFNRLVLDSPPGSIVRLGVERGGQVREVEVPVRELDTMPRV